MIPLLFCRAACARVFRDTHVDCAVCETGYSSSLTTHACTRCSSSRRKGLMTAVAVIGTLVGGLVVVLICRYVLSTELGEEKIGFFRRRVLRAVPLQALKIIVVVWQILTQVHLAWFRCTARNVVRADGCELRPHSFRTSWARRSKELRFFAGERTTHST